jgi:hypothetical protein
MRVNVLSPGFTTSNGSAFLFPLVVHRKALQNANLDVHFVKRFARELTECDVLAIDSKEFMHDWSPEHQTQTLDLISSYKDSRTKIFWFDTSDSTGTLQSRVFPSVDRYLKSQILTDKTEYTRQIYGGRIYSEYYHEKADITDDAPAAIDNPISTEDISKLGVSWNSGLSDYSTYGPWKIALYNRISLSRLLRHPAVIEKSGSQRSNDLSARFGATYRRASVRYQREKIRELLSSRLDTQKLNRRGYVKELRNSKVVLSPFGWGEITLKDFEVFLTGGMLLKPSLDHMATWPDFYEKNVTYLAHYWDLVDLEQQIDWAVENDDDREAIAHEGQRRYIEYTSGPNAAEHFAIHLSKVLST